MIVEHWIHRLARLASSEPEKRFDRLFREITKPEFLQYAFESIKNNKGANTAGADGKTKSDWSIREAERLTQDLRNTSSIITGRIAELEIDAEDSSRRLTMIREELLQLEMKTVDRKDVVRAIEHFNPIWDVLYRRRRRPGLRRNRQARWADQSTGDLDYESESAGAQDSRRDSLLAKNLTGRRSCH